jgi:hypothetical protein
MTEGMGLALLTAAVLAWLVVAAFYDDKLNKKPPRAANDDG